MARHSPLLERIRMRLQYSPRGDLLRRGMRVFLEKGDLVLEGEVADVADKKTALVQSAMVTGVGPIIDRLHVRPSARRSDAEILTDVRRLLAAEVALADCLVQGPARGNPSRTMVLCPEGWQGDIEIRVEDGVVTVDGEVPRLAQKCLASILAWSVPGCRDVIDGLGVDAPEEDSDTAMTDAIRLAIGRLSPSRGEPLTVRVTGGVVTLSGEVASWDEAREIDRMVWGMFGVAEVRNQLALPGPHGAVERQPPPEAVTGAGIAAGPKAL